MKKSATTLVEILIAMTLMIVLTVICMTGLRVFVSKDTDIVKFKHVYGSVSAAVYELINDVIMYPSAKGFADTSEHSYNEETKVYGGEDKFKKLFKSKFNIFNNDVVIDLEKVMESMQDIFKQFGDKGLSTALTKLTKD